MSSNKYYPDSPVLIPDSNVKFFDAMRNAVASSSNNQFQASAKLGGVEYGTGYNLGVKGSINDFKVGSSFPKKK